MSVALLSGEPYAWLGSVAGARRWGFGVEAGSAQPERSAALAGKIERGHVKA